MDADVAVLRVHTCCLALDEKPSPQHRHLEKGLMYSGSAAQTDPEGVFSTGLVTDFCEGFTSDSRQQA